MVLLCLTALPIVVMAQTQAPSSDQLLSIFNNLSPDQQQQLLTQINGGANGSASNGQLGGNAGGLNPQNQVTQEAHRRAPSGDRTQYAPDGSPLLKAFDTVLIDISVNRPAIAAPLPQTIRETQTSAVNSIANQAAAAQQSAMNQNNNEGGNSKTDNDQATPQMEPLTPEEADRTRKLIDLVHSRSPYSLDRNGALHLPGFAPMPLAGLTEALATRRIRAEPAFVKLYLKLTLLPLTPTGIASLKPYGYDLFTSATNLNTPTDVPVPDEYIVGPGDEFTVQLFGSQNRTLRVIVDRDGKVPFPELGPITVSGRRFGEVQADIQGRISRQMIGVRGSVSMGNVRAISVFVVGEVQSPGSYTVNGLSTITGALFISGGVKAIGSLRDIQLKRAGQVVRHLDLYDLLMRGDTSNDSHLLPGDVIFVPPVGATVSVDGEVQRPAIYELRGPSDVSKLIDMAGGLSAEADTQSAELTRIDSRQQRIVLEVDLSSKAPSEPLKNGDVLRVARLRPTLDSGVTVQGEVFHPGAFAWRENLKLTDVIQSLRELRESADQHYLLIRREQPPDRHIEALSADLTAALRDPGSAANLVLSPRDQITVFDLEAGRRQLVTPLLNELRLQSNQSAPAQTVTVSGNVKAAGVYPLEAGMRVSDLIRAGGSLDDAAYGGAAELSRYEFENGQVRRTQVIAIDLAAALRGDTSANFTLQPYDGLYIKEISGWSVQEQVTLSGEVRFPGTYPIKRGETLQSVVARAGGLTDLAFPEGGVFTREELRTREQQEIDRLTDRMQNELAATSLMAARSNQSGAVQTFSIGQSLLSQLKATRAVGRLVIDLQTSLHAAAGSADDIVLKNGDALIIPKRNQEVTVIGEVQNVSSHLYQPSLGRDDYLHLSGGMTRMADASHIYVVRADGSVVSGGSRWLRSATASIHAGDTIVVPMNTERVPALPLWLSVTTILYNIAIAVAAVHSL
jgi:protein involved in polysaccharide export with SLBB domain